MQLWGLTLRPSTLVASWLILDISLDMTQNMGSKCKRILAESCHVTSRLCEQREQPNQAQGQPRHRGRDQQRAQRTEENQDFGGPCCQLV